MISRFAMVGFAAMGTHWFIAALLISAGMPALPANLLGFLCALSVSYQGHARWSFASHRHWRQTLPRFLLAAISGFALNELLYSAGLLWLTLDPRLLLALVILCVAAVSFIVYRFWAFA